MNKILCDQCGIELTELSDYLHLNNQRLHIHMEMQFPKDRVEYADICSIECAKKYLESQKGA